MSLARLCCRPLFLTLVAAPTLLASIYYCAIASDIYISESRFVVRSPERSTASPFGAMFKGSGFSAAEDDAYVIKDYILSRDALTHLDRTERFREHYSSDAVDRLSRFAGIDFDTSFEALHSYYQERVHVALEPTSSIVSLRSMAYSAEKAVAINRALVGASEQLVNELNERGRRDLLAAAERDVHEALQRDLEAATALSLYRNSNSVIDPEKQSLLQLEQVAKLNEELLQTRGQILQLESLASESGQLPVLRQRASLLTKQIADETARIAGTANSSLAAKAADYHQLLQAKEFSAKMLASAMGSLEQARSESRRKQLYLELIASPSTPDVAVEPRRLRAVLLTLLIGLICFGIASMAHAGIKEHRS